jgi:hypothetical protein
MDGVVRLWHRAPRPPSSVVEDREVESVQGVGRGEHVDVDDLAVPDRAVPRRVATV